MNGASCIRRSMAQRHVHRVMRMFFTAPGRYCKLTSDDGVQLRSVTCGQLTRGHVDQSVVLCGWLQYKRMRRFIVLRDAHGITQVLLPEHETFSETVSALPLESVLKVTGTVLQRPEGQANTKLPTGDVEVLASDIEVLNQPQKKLPFPVSKFSKAGEEVRLRYRYLDLRSEQMQRRLRLRSEMLMRMRECLVREHDFIEVETPTLFRRTPGGAQEFVVPTRQPGRFYSLVQSPQQFKQLLMVGGIDRYFQVARCYRDEGARPDRQPEFTQVDVEVAFSTQLGIQRLVERLIQRCWPPDGMAAIPTPPFPRLSYHQCMNEYGTDQPDTRIPWKLRDVTEMLRDSGCDVISRSMSDCDNSSAFAIAIPSGQIHYSASARRLDRQLTVESGVSVLTSMHVGDTVDRPLIGGLASKLRPQVAARLMSACDALPGDLLLVAAAGVAARTLLGRLRVRMADRLEAAGVQVRSPGFEFVWVEDFPLFERDGDGRLVSTHHPFTRPRDEHLPLIYSSPEQAVGQHFDLVLNGWEVGGGSMRIHEASLQRHVVQHVLQQDPEPLEHLLEALTSGAPPHGGIALGVDRILALMCGVASIRDVIAFPKTSEGRDLMADAPAAISAADRAIYNLPAS